VDSPPPIASAPAIGLAWIVRLRWLFALAEAIVISGALWLGLPVHWAIAVLAPILTLATNLFLWTRRHVASPPLLVGALVLDSVLLTVVLRSAGGAMNPFSVLYLVHVALAALVLDRRASWLVAGATCLGFGALFAGTNPHVGAMHDHARMEAHLYGMLVAYAVAALFVGYFVHRIARALEAREQEALALRDWAARTEKLASLTTLAAGTAHELGSPLATIAVVATELGRSARAPTIDRDALASDAELLRGEAERCRRILAKMSSSAGESRGSAPRRTPVRDVFERVSAQLGEPRATLLVQAGADALWVLAPEDALVQVLASLVANAFEAESPRVILATALVNDRVAFRVEDEGKGMNEALLRRLGEPFFSTKSGRGMGLGVFLARRFAQDVDGTLDVESVEGKGSTFVLAVPGGNG
jgi:two-component system sensor histidine kinase RegB